MPAGWQHTLLRTAWVGLPGQVSQAGGYRSQRHLHGHEEGDLSTYFVLRVPTLTAHFLNSSVSILQLSQALRRCQKSPGSAKKVETIFGIQKGSCGTRTQVGA